MPWGRLDLASVLVWATLLSLALVRVVVHRATRRSVTRVTARQLLVLAPAIFSFLMAYWAFGSGHGHPTRQLGDSGKWSWWVAAWLPLLASCFVAGLIALVQAGRVWSAASTSLSLSSFGWAGIAGADWISAAFVFANWPSA